MMTPQNSTPLSPVPNALGTPAQIAQLPDVRDRPLIVSVNLTTICNLACTYCHAIHRRDRLGPEDLQHTAVHVGALDEPALIVPFGGEPLAVWKEFKQLVESSEAHGTRDFLLCSNGLLANQERIRYFIDHNIELTVSWDGVPEANDKLRVYADGRGTSGEFAALFALLREHYTRRLQVRITVGPDTAQFFAPSVRYLFDALADRPGVKICFMPVSTDAWTPEQLNQLSQGLREATDAWLAAKRAGHDVALAYNECIRSHELGEQILFDDSPESHACLWGVKMLGVDTDGGIFPCHTVVELRQEQREHLRMGHVSEGVPDLATRLELMPPPEGNPYHCCYAWNLVGSGDPFRVPEVYKRVYRVFLDESLRAVSLLAPGKVERATERHALLLERTARWDRELAASARPQPKLAIERRAGNG